MIEAHHRADRWARYRRHAFAGDGHDCELCGEGRCYYLHVDRPSESGDVWRSGGAAR